MRRRLQESRSLAALGMRPGGRCTSTVPGPLPILVLYRSWSSTDPGPLPFLFLYRSWSSTDPGPLPFLVPLPFLCPLPLLYAIDHSIPRIIHLPHSERSEEPALLAAWPAASSSTYSPASRARSTLASPAISCAASIEHKTKSIPGFTAKYRIDRLVHFEESDFPDGGDPQGEGIERMAPREESRAHRAERILRGTTWHAGGTIPAEPGCLDSHGVRRLAD